MTNKFSVLIKDKISSYNKKIKVPPDKSCTHRCIILASQCCGISKITGLESEDIRTTINGLRLLGTKIVKKKKVYHL